MIYTAAAILSLASQCAPNVAPQTVLAIVQTESRGYQFALNVNGARQPGRQSKATDAAATARRYIAKGYSVDLGLGQINSRNMRRLGLTWDNVFDPCTNIAALGKVLSQNYESVKDGRHPQTALRLALSMYNTGSISRGFRNGYVAKVVRNAGMPAGAIASLPGEGQSPNDVADVRSVIVAENAAPSTGDEAARPTPPPSWNVFERAAYERELRIQAATAEGASL